jgi:hypothetical protein
MSGTNPCLYDITGDKTGQVNFQKLFTSGPLEVKNKLNDYHYEACSGVPCNGAQCGSDTCVACQKADKNYGLGDISTVSCDVSQSTPSNNTWIIKLSYTGGSDGRKCDFTFVYSPSDAQPELTFDQEKPGLDYHLTVLGDFGIPGAPATDSGVDPGIVGIVLIALLIIAAVSYLVVGIIIQVAVRGARGVEVIPNLSFWKDFPFLLKDGILFTFTWPCVRNRGGSYSSAKV